MLRSQHGYLLRSAAAYDDGHDDESRRLAVTLRLLLHDGSTASLLTQLGLRKGLHCTDTSLKPSPGLLSPPGLALLRMHGDPDLALNETSWVPPLDRFVDGRCHPAQRYADWWSEPVIGSGIGGPVGPLLARRDLVLGMASTDGGAHVDQSLDPDYARFRDSNAGWTATVGGLEVPIRHGSLAAASMRQIAYEMIHHARGRRAHRSPARTTWTLKRQGRRARPGPRSRGRPQARRPARGDGKMLTEAESSWSARWPWPLPSAVGQAEGPTQWEGPVRLLGAADGAPTGDIPQRGRVHWVWRPEPLLVIDVDTDESWRAGRLNLDDMLPQPEVGAIRGAVPIRLSAPFDPVVRRFAVDEVQVGDHLADTAAASFAVLNLPRFLGDVVHEGGQSFLGRLDLRAQGWHAELVATPREPKDLLLDGYALTHTGRLTRDDGVLFHGGAAEPVLLALARLLSLFRGAYTAPLAWRGLDRNGGLLWYRERHFIVDRWRGGNGGLLPTAIVHDENPGFAEALGGTWSALMDLAAEQPRHELVERVLFWYLSAQAMGALGDFMLGQAALELLAYEHLVLDSGVDPASSDRLPAADRIRLLLARCGEPLPVPEHLAALHAAARKSGADGPAVITDWRNRTVHPPRRVNPAVVPHLAPDLAVDARDLLLWYVERALLHRLGYESWVQDRLQHRYARDLRADRQKRPASWRG